MSDFKAKMHQIRFRLELRPDPAGGAYSAPPESLAGIKKPTSKGREGNKREGGGREGRGKGKEEGKGKVGEREGRGKGRNGEEGPPLLFGQIEPCSRDVKVSRPA